MSDRLGCCQGRWASDAIAINDIRDPYVLPIGIQATYGC